MKIERIELHQLVGHIDAPYKSSMTWKTTRNTLAVRVIADDGTYGWGETGTDAKGFAEVAQGVIGEETLKTSAASGNRSSTPDTKEADTPASYPTSPAP